MRAFLILLLLLASQARAEGPEADFEFFETRIRPVLIAHCYECHSASAKVLQGGLRLDTRATSRRGGDSGAAVIPQDTENSLLYIKGSIPGSKNSLVFLRKSIKSINRKTSIEKFAQETKQVTKKETKPSDKKAEQKKPDVKKDAAKEQPKKK